MIKNGRISGKGTIEDPYLYAWDTFTGMTHIAKFLSYSENWSDIHNSLEGPKNKRVYYKYKQWKRGPVTFFFNEHDWAHLIDLIELLRQRGFDTTPCHKHLVALDKKAMLKSMKVLCKAANSVHLKNTKLILKEDDRVTFRTNEGIQIGKVIKKNSKLYVTYNDYGSKAKLVSAPIDENSKNFSILRQNQFKIK